MLLSLVFLLVTVCSFDVHNFFFVPAFLANSVADDSSKFSIKKREKGTFCQLVKTCFFWKYQKVTLRRWFQCANKSFPHHTHRTTEVIDTNETKNPKFYFDITKLING